MIVIEAQYCLDPSQLDHQQAACLDNYSPQPISRELGQLITESAMCRCAHGVHLLDLWLHARKALQGERILRALGMVHDTRGDLMAESVSSAGHDVGISVLLVVCKVTSALHELGERVRHVVRDTAPDITALECSHLQGRHDAKVVQTTSEGNPEVRVTVSVGVDHRAGAQDHLEFQHRVAGKTGPT